MAHAVYQRFVSKCDLGLDFHTSTRNRTTMYHVHADTGGFVEMQWGPNPLVHEGEAICTITDHFKDEAHTVEIPFTGFIVGVLENPVALPGHPICHLVRTSSETREEIEREISRGEFDGYRPYGQRWIADEEDAE